ncbi:MAG: hypothetical protein HDR12_15715 [Lachnospiraceae bacterium]|nr:hypothetical protein [Lachnospiraceae bacterium]
MAQLINLRETEYQTIVTELSKMHTDQLQCVEDVITKLRNIVTSDDIFSANQTSKKMEDMLDMVTSDIKALLEQVFNDSEAGVANMISSITTTDSACS